MTIKRYVLLFSLLTCADGYRTRSHTQTQLMPVPASVKFHSERLAVDSTSK